MVLKGSIKLVKMDFAGAEFFRQDIFSTQHVDTFGHLSTHIGGKDIEITCYIKWFRVRKVT